MRMLAVLLLLALVALFWLRHENASLTQSLAQSTQRIDWQKQSIDALTKQLQSERQLSDEKELAQAELREKLGSASARVQHREQTIARLLSENETLRHWYDANLPDAVRRLHQRAACASAADCLQRLPKGQPLPAPGQ